MQFLFYSITSILLLIVTISSYKLSSKDSKQKNVCPKIIGIPACYIVFICFSIAFICHLVNTITSNQVYFIFIGIPGIIALIGSLTEISGKTVFPKTESKKPMCYFSLAFCATLIIIKHLSF